MTHYRRRTMRGAMAPVSERNGTPSPGELILEALEEPGRSIRWLAIQLAGPDATTRRVETRRRYLQKVLPNPAWRPTPARAAVFAEVLGLDVSRLLAAKPARGRAASLAELRARVDDLTAEVRALRIAAGVSEEEMTRALARVEAADEVAEAEEKIRRRAARRQPPESQTGTG